MLFDHKNRSALTSLNTPDIDVYKRQDLLFLSVVYQGTSPLLNYKATSKTVRRTRFVSEQTRVSLSWNLTPIKIAAVFKDVWTLPCCSTGLC